MPQHYHSGDMTPVNQSIGSSGGGGGGDSSGSSGRLNSNQLRHEVRQCRWAENRNYFTCCTTAVATTAHAAHQYERILHTGSRCSRQPIHLYICITQQLSGKSLHTYCIVLVSHKCTIFKLSIVMSLCFVIFHGLKQDIVQGIHVSVKKN
jgi:hypothetical protein